jgi:hypothetical protein
MFTGQSLKELVVQKGQELIPLRSSYLDKYGIVDRLGLLRKPFFIQLHSTQYALVKIFCAAFFFCYTQYLYFAFSGSLVVRLIFRPFGESNRLKFAEMASGVFLFLRFSYLLYLS